MAADKPKREISNLRGKQARGWSDWKTAMIPPNTEAANFERRGQGEVGFMWSGIRNTFGDKGKQCGIYEWQAKREGQAPRIVYVGSTCRRKPAALRDRILEYCTTGSNKASRINSALRKGYELRVRVKGAGGCSPQFKKKAEDMENELLRKYDYAWNKQKNGGKQGMRNILR